jgi:hypothetical protein
VAAAKESEQIAAATKRGFFILCKKRVIKFFY